MSQVRSTFVRRWLFVRIALKLREHLITSGVVICQFQVKVYLVRAEDIGGIILGIARVSQGIISTSSEQTSSRNSFSHARRSRVKVSRVANTRGGSQVKDGKEVMRRFKNLEATSRALAMRCVLDARSARSSLDSA